jgi:hypothetical protein
MPTTIVKDSNIVDELYSYHPHSGAKDGEREPIKGYFRQAIRPWHQQLQM